MKQGRAQYEYINPALVRTDSVGNIYVWCDMSLKIIIFDKTGLPIDEIQYSKAIRDFLPYRNLISFYLLGNENHIIEIYDRNNGNVVHYAGKSVSQEHLMLALNETSGGMTMLEDDLLFAYADRPEIYSVNLDDFTDDALCARADDSDFKAESIEGKVHDIIDQGRMSVLNYLSQNSVVTGLYAMGDAIALKATTGCFDVDESMLIFNDTRKDKIHIFDKNMNFIQTIAKDKDHRSSDKWFTCNNNGLFYLSTTEGSLDNYYLNRLNIE